MSKMEWEGGGGRAGWRWEEGKEWWEVGGDATFL